MELSKEQVFIDNSNLEFNKYQTAQCSALDIYERLAIFEIPFPVAHLKTNWFYIDISDIEFYRPSLHMYLEAYNSKFLKLNKMDE